MYKEFCKAGQLLLAIIFCFKVYSQENPERLRQLQIANQGNNSTTSTTNQAAKIEASKGTNTLPPGLKTTQMVSDQYKSSGALKPYQTTIQSNGSTGVFVPSASPKNNAKMPPGGTPSGMANKKLPPGSASTPVNSSQTSGAALANQLPTNFPTSSGSKEKVGNTPIGGSGTANSSVSNADVFRAPYNTSSANTPIGKSGTANSSVSNAEVFRAPYSTSPANNTYDKVPAFNPYQQAPSTPANPYGSLQLTPGNQQTNVNSGTSAINTGTSKVLQGTTNSYGAPPITGATNGEKRTQAYGPAPALNPQGSNNTYGAPPVTGANNQAKQSGTYGPAPALNSQATNNTYGAPPVTGANNQAKQTATYGPAPALNSQATNNTYGAPPVTGANNQAKQTGTYGPAPALNPQGTNNNYAAPPVTGSQSAGSVPSSTQPNLKTGVNSTVPPNSPKGGANNATPKKSPPKRGR